MKLRVRTRIAPSPTGQPHIGTIFQALVNYLIAKHNNGVFAVRIEDTDQQRYVAGAEQALFDAFTWAGLEPDESPVHGGQCGPYRQSERLKLYQQYAKELVDKGQAYYCFCSPERLIEMRKQAQKQGKPPMYDKHCRMFDTAEAAERAKNEAHVIRMKVPENETIRVVDEIRGEINFDSAVVDDQVILKSDGYPTYHLGVVVDDHLMEITHMVRGEEWISSAPKHVLLYSYFGWEMPKFIHTPLLRNPDKSKLSKRHGHAAVSWYREQGYLPEAVLNFLASRVWNHPEGKEIYGLDELVKYFDVADMHIQGPIVDLQKLDWINGQWIRNMKSEELLARAVPYLPQELNTERMATLLPLIQDRLVKLSEITELTSYFVKQPELNLKLLLKQSKVSHAETANYLEQVLKVVDKTTFQPEVLEDACRTLQQTLEIKPRPAFMTIRVALTGKEATPPLFEVMAVLGKTETVKRLKSLVTALQNTRSNNG
jgi:glutamyl-tRNA synthetase